MSATGETHDPWYRHHMSWVLVIFMITYLLVPTFTHPVVSTITLLLGIFISADATRRMAPRARPLTLTIKGMCVLLVIVSAVRFGLGKGRAGEVYELDAGSALLFGTVSTLAAYALFRHVVGQTRVGLDQIAAAICVYYLLAVIWASLYLVLLSGDPHAFKGISLDAGSNFDPLYLLYFSMVTLTTLGYGDISPATGIGGTLATLEAFVGQVYLTVLVARLVGLYIAQNPVTPDDGEEGDDGGEDG